MYMYDTGTLPEVAGICVFLARARALAFQSSLCMRPAPQHFRAYRKARPVDCDAAPAALPPGILRWLVDVEAWEVAIGGDEWQLLLKCLSEAEATKVMRFMHAADKKRALVSRLLQRRACHEVTGLSCADVVVERTKGGKPFMANKPRPMSGAPNFNYNVSHEGRYVALAAEPHRLCGIDVAAPETSRSGKPRPMTEQLKLVERQLTRAEVACIMRAGPEERAMEAVFRRFWSLKEAYTKARGDGLGFEFHRCDFQLCGVTRGAAGQPVQMATVAVDGTPLPHWCFAIQGLGHDHCVSVACGPTADIVDAHGRFTRTLEHVHAGDSAPGGMAEADRAQCALAAQCDWPEPLFTVKTVADLVPDEFRPEYERLGLRKGKGTTTSTTSGS